jgi:hypothetical protein
LANWHPHLDLVVTEGCFRPDRTFVRWPGIFYRRIGDAPLTLEAFERSGQLGARDQIVVVDIQDIRRSVPVGR